ncbi:hypothetical protein V1281_006194 [Nitrobacteraceae bacterium AZCC 2161]
MSDIRVWHASRDPYHCAFRFLRLLSAGQNQIPVERLRVLDMYLLYPSLLHRASMPREIGRKFGELEIEKPEKLFLRLPSAAAIFQDLRLYQNSATTQLVARGILDHSQIAKGNALLRIENCPDLLMQRVRQKNSSEQNLLNFLLIEFSSLPLRGPDSVYRKAGLPRRAIAA